MSGYLVNPKPQTACLFDAAYATLDTFVLESLLAHICSVYMSACQPVSADASPGTHTRTHACTHTPLKLAVIFLQKRLGPSAVLTRLVLCLVPCASQLVKVQSAFAKKPSLCV